MAKANWVKVNPTSYAGDAVVNVSSEKPHTGRIARHSTLTWKAANVEDVVRNVSQAGKPEFVDIDDSAASSKEGKKVTIAGVSNSAKLTFSLGTGNLQISLPATYIANSEVTNNGTAISGDPGASQEYSFSITVDVPENESMNPQSRQIIVSDEAGHQDVCLLTLAAGDAFIKISTSLIELNWQGDAVSVFVDSNTQWTVE